MAADPSRSAWPAVPGPVDRESFFAAQRRNRRSAWRLSALSASIVVLMGMPLAAVISPLLYGFAFIAADLLNKLVPTPDIAHLGMTAAGRVMDAIGSPKPLPVGTAVRGAVYLLAPGAILLLLLWLALRARFLGSGVGGVLLSLGAREPRPGDLEESQLVHVVEEMAIAAGVKAPRVRLLDAAAGANAAVVGSSIDDAVVVVSRRLLDELDRDETQAVVGHLVGAAANGDLRAALSLVSVYQALGLAATLLSAPYSRDSRHALRLFAPVLWRRGRADEEAVTALLTRPLRSGDDENDLDRLPQGKFTTFLRSVLVIPFMTAWMSFYMTQAIVTMLAIGPLAALAWRSRRYLADATAVQLTRDPEALARALAHLAREATAIRGAGWASHLFVVWPSGSAGRGGGGDDQPSLGFGGMSFQPTPERRLKRLQRMGALIVDDPAATLRPRVHLSSRARLGFAIALLVLVPLGLLMVWMLLVAAGLLVLVSLAIDGLFFFVLVVGPLHALLR
jgi:Zn-dependent protease with chaperone function